MNCPHCGRDLDLVQGQQYCTYCGGNLEHAEDAGEEKPIDDPAITGLHDLVPAGTHAGRPNAYCPWEDQEQLGFIEGILQTLRGSLFRPYDFFATIPLMGGLLQPLLFALIVETLGTMMGILWGVTMNPSLLSGPNAVAVALVPVLLFFKIAFWALILHASLFLVGGAKEDFEATFRAVCYTSGPELFNAFPFVGGFIAIGWRIYITVIALKQIHRISTGKAVLAIFLPSILCFAVISFIMLILVNMFTA